MSKKEIESKNLCDELRKNIKKQEKKNKKHKRLIKERAL